MAVGIGGMCRKLVRRLGSPGRVGGRLLGMAVVLELAVEAETAAALGGWWAGAYGGTVVVVVGS